MLKFTAFIILSVFLVFSIPAITSKNKSKKVGKISFFVGKAIIKKLKSKKWKKIKINTTINEGDRMQTARAECIEIKLIDGSILRIAEESDIVISCPSKSIISPEIKKGRIWANIKKLGKRNYDFQVSSGTATAAIRGTIFRMDNNPKDSLTQVLVYDGKVDVGPGVKLEKRIKEIAQKSVRKEVFGPQEISGPTEVSLMDWVSIVQGQQINIKTDGKYEKFKFDSKKDSLDKWVQFNRERDLAVKINHKPEAK